MPHTLPDITGKCTPVCGDGFVLAPETCDDMAVGGCNSSCRGVNLHFQCTGGSKTSPSVCTCASGY